MRHVGEKWRPHAGAGLLLALLAAPLWVHSRPAEKGAAPPAKLTAEQAQDELPRAIRDGDEKRVGELLKAGANVNERDADGTTPLILAALYAGPDCVKLLLDKGAEVDTANDAGVTPLVQAATNFEKVKLLIAAGAKVKVRTNRGSTPLMLAARRYGDSATVKLLLDKGADAKDVNAYRDGYTAISVAAASGDIQTVRLLLDNGADVDNGDGYRTPLVWAAYQNNLPMMQLLLDRKADPNKSDPGLGQALTQAAWHDSVEAAELLLKNGARVRATDGLGFTALHWAAATDSPRSQMVKLLLKNGADPNAKGGENIDAVLGEPQTPLMLALKRGETEIVTALRTAGAKAPPPAKPLAHPVRKLPDALTQPVFTAATERAIAVLQKTATESVKGFLRQAKKQDCVSCHQQYLPMAAVGHARGRGVHIDEEAAQDQIDLLQRMARRSATRVFESEYVL